MVIMDIVREGLRRNKRYLYSVMLMITVTSGAMLLRTFLTLANFTLIYTLIVLMLAIQSGTRVALIGAILSFLVINFFLIHPYYTFIVADPRELLDLVIFLVVALLVGQLAARARTQARKAQQRAYEQEVLYRLARSFNQLTTSETVYTTLVHFVKMDLSGENVYILPEQTAIPRNPATHYILLQSATRIFGTLCIDFGEAPSEEVLQLLRACGAQAAMALHRIELNERARKSQQYEDADRLKTAILHSVSHDLRTPITIIKTSTSNLHRLDASLTQAERSEMFEAIEEQADQLDRLVGNLLDMSRLQAGALTLNVQANSFEEIAGEVAARMFQRNKMERIRLQIPEDFPFVLFDYALLLQAITNIVENGLRYEPQESQIEIQAKQVENEAQLSVINHGESISDEERTHIMEPFYHGKKGNSGLGLAIAKGIVEAHHGRLWVEDTPGRGVTFVIALPFQRKEFQ